jgi:hypothetical protein
LIALSLSLSLTGLDWIGLGWVGAAAAAAAFLSLLGSGLWTQLWNETKEEGRERDTVGTTVLSISASQGRASGEGRTRTRVLDHANATSLLFSESQLGS